MEYRSSRGNMYGMILSPAITYMDSFYLSHKVSYLSIPSVNFIHLHSCIKRRRNYIAHELAAPVFHFQPLDRDIQQSSDVLCSRAEDSEGVEFVCRKFRGHWGKPSSSCASTRYPLEERPFRSSMTAVNSVSSPKALCTASMTLMTWLSIIFNDIIARHLEGIHTGRAATPQCHPWTYVTVHLECEQIHH